MGEQEYIYFEHARSSSFLVRGKDLFLRWADLPSRHPRNATLDFKKASLPDLLAYLAKSNLRSIVEEVLVRRDPMRALRFSPCSTGKPIEVKELTLVLAANLSHQEQRLNINVCSLSFSKSMASRPTSPTV